MILRIRYEDELQDFELDAEATDDLCITLSIETKGLSRKEIAEKAQAAFDEQFNRDEYNNWHKETRHVGFSKAKTDDENYSADCELLMSEVLDDSIFYKSETERDRHIAYEEICSKIRTSLSDKPHWAEAFIAVCMDDMNVQNYAVSIGLKDASTVSHWLTRAKSKLKEVFQDYQF